jgi:uncharacterized protein YgiM (DUF1202 family)
MSRFRNCLFGFFILAAAAAFAAAPKQMSVTVKETQVRVTPGFMGKILAALVYGDRVQVVDVQNGWAKVNLPAVKSGSSGSRPQVEGWVHLSALTDKKIVLKSGAANVGETASSGEVALAGKGFNEEVEAQYKENNKLDYTWVDRMESFVVSPEQAVTFLQEGGLAERGAQ